LFSSVNIFWPFLLSILILDLLSNMHDMLQIKSLLKCSRKRTFCVKKDDHSEGDKISRYSGSVLPEVRHEYWLSKLKHHYAFSNLSNWWTYASYIKVCERDLVFTSKLWHWGLKSSFLNTDGNHNKSVYLKYSAFRSLCTFGSLSPGEKMKTHNQIISFRCLVTIFCSMKKIVSSC
jgi:hypothetical protein